MIESRVIDRASLRRVVTVLCISEIVSWGVLFYAFPVLATDIAADEGWPLTRLVAAFTVAQLVAAASGVWVGRHLDRHGPRRIMTAGSALGVVSIVCLASAPSFAWFAASWVLAGCAMSATLYPPAFAAITHLAGDEHRVRALTIVTLVAGFASTVFAPLTAVLAGLGSWRTAYLFLLIPLCLTIPLHWWGLVTPWQPRAATQLPSTATEGRRGAGADRVLRQPAFLLLVIAMTLSGFCVYAVVINFVPLLAESGISTTAAAVALGIGGAGQVAGRLMYGPVMTRLTPAHKTAVTLAATTVTTAALALVRDPLVAVCLISFAAGGARGIFTLIQATAVSDRWGVDGYGARSGILSAGTTGAAAFAPWIGAATAAALGSYQAAFLVLAGCSAVAALMSAAERAPQASR